MIHEQSRIDFTEEEGKELIRKATEFELPETRFNFVNDHSGFRKGNIHVLMGTTGQGKSTLARSLLLDMASKVKVFLFSTEETLEQTKTMLARRDITTTQKTNLQFLHQRELEEYSSGDLKEALRILEIKIMNWGSGIFIFDNITTWRMYDQATPQMQGEISNKMSKMLLDCNIPGLFVAHTAANVRDDQKAKITPDQIRGAKTLAISAEFIYAYQRIIQKAGPGQATPIYGFVNTTKARGYGTNYKHYLLGFDWNKSEYVNDKVITNDEYKKIFDEQFTLGGR